jgi:hypothetical protein
MQQRELAGRRTESNLYIALVAVDRVDRTTRMLRRRPPNDFRAAISRRIPAIGSCIIRGVGLPWTHTN